MAVDLYTSEGGTPGATVTTGNSAGASGTAFYAIPAFPAGTLVTFNGESGNGSVGLAFTRSSGSATFYLVRNFTASANRAVSFMFMVPALPSTNITLMAWRAPGDVQQAFFAINSANKLEFRNSLNAAVSTATNAIVAGQWYTVSTVINPGATTTTGTGKWKYALGNSATPVQELSFTGANLATVGTSQFIRVGRTGDAWVNTVHYDDIAMDNSTEYIGPVGVTPPTLVKTEGVVWRLDLRGSLQGNAGALSYPTPTKVSGPTLTFTEPADGLFIFNQDATLDAVYTFVVSEVGGGTSAQDYVIPKALTGAGGLIGAELWDETLGEWV